MTKACLIDILQQTGTKLFMYKKSRINYCLPDLFFIFR